MQLNEICDPGVAPRSVLPKSPNSWRVSETSELFLVQACAGFEWPDIKPLASSRTIACGPVSGARSSRSARVFSIELICSRTSASRAAAPHEHDLVLGYYSVHTTRCVMAKLTSRRSRRASHNKAASKQTPFPS